jgi:hypothetical protein
MWVPDEILFQHELLWHEQGTQAVVSIFQGQVQVPVSTSGVDDLIVGLSQVINQKSIAKDIWLLINDSSLGLYSEKIILVKKDLKNINSANNDLI